MVNLVQDKVSILAALVASAATPLLDGQPGLGAVQSLNLAFYSTQRTIASCGGFRYRPTTSVIFIQNLRIARQLEGFRAMWLQLVQLACGGSASARKVWMVFGILLRAGDGAPL
jgi:hypothetical protein